MDQSSLMDIHTVWIKFIGQMLILTLTGIVAALTVFLRKKIIESIISFLEMMLKWRDREKEENPTKFEIMRDIKIHDMLADLRNQSNSDRSYVCQFHNGTIFTTKNQMWKITRTHESVNKGITACIGDTQGIISSSVHELLIPLWETDISNRPGITKISPDNCNCSGKDKCAFPHGVYFYIIENMNEGYTKGLLMSQAVQYMVITPLLDQDFNRIGFVGLDYCWKDANMDKIKKSAEAICKAASVISYELKKKV